MDWGLNPAGILPAEEARLLRELLKLYEDKAAANRQKEKYYEGKIRLSEVNLGIALPKGMRDLEIGCAWGAKTVDVLAARSMFDGFVGTKGEDAEELNRIAEGNRLGAEYLKACRDELKFGCTFATLSADEALGCRIRFHPPTTAAALWDGEKGRIRAGFAIIDGENAPVYANAWTPTLINFYTEGAIWVLRRGKSGWTAEEYRHRMGRPLMEPLVWNATSGKPFGRSRIKEPIRRLIQGFVRTVANATIGLEFATAPQKYLLGVTDEQFDEVTASKFQQYVGSILTATANPETGETPSFGQLQQGTISPHVSMLRILATQFSAATGLPITDTGVVNDANPTSSDAIEAQTKTLVALAEELNKGNGESLKTIGLMALAIAKSSAMEELTDSERDIMARFKNPAMPSVAATADAAVKIATSRQSFAQTDTFLEMVGFDAATIRRIKGQEQRGRGLAFLEALEDGGAE